MTQSSPNPRRILLYGGAGYIGSVVTNYLLNQGYQIRSFDRLLYENHCCVLPYLTHPQYEFIFGDIAEKSAMTNALEGVTDVVIFAGLVGDPITKKYPEVSERINTEGIQNIIQHLNNQNLTNVIFISTCSNYGLIKDTETADESFELKPLSLYAKAKVAMEKELLSLEGKVDYSPTILRFATAFGLSPRMRFDLTVNEFIREMYLGNELLVYDANTWRPYCHVQDFAKVIHEVLEAPQTQTAFEVFNAGGEMNNFTKQNIIDTIKTFFPNTPVKYQKHGTDPRNYRVNFQKIRKQLGFEPQYSIEDGVQELVASLQQKLFDRVEQQPNFYGNYSIKYP